MRRPTTAQRYEALALIRIGTSHRAVTRRFNCHHSTIDRLADRYHETNSVQDRTRSQRSTATNPRQDQHVKINMSRSTCQDQHVKINMSRSTCQDQHVMLMHARNRFLTAASTVGRIQHTHQFTVCTSTIRCRLRTAGMTSRRLIVDTY